MPTSQPRSSSAYRTRRRWTAKEATEALAALKRSGLPLTAFAMQEGLDAQRLSRWRSKLAVVSAPVFEEVVPRTLAPVGAIASATSSTPEPFEIVLTSGHVVRVPASFDGSALRRLMETLAEVRAC